MENPGRPPDAAPLRILSLKKRADFVKTQAGTRAPAGTFLLVRSRNSSDETRLGFTVTKKLGKAVLRNRIRRRLKEAARQVFPEYAAAGFDYVVIARSAAQSRPFALLLDDMKRALLRLSSLPK